MLAVIGAVAYAWKPQTESGERIALPGGRFRRIALGVVLTGTALLAPADQIHLHTLTALQKHVGFGLFFAAPMAGVGLARIIGDHFRRAQVGIAIWGGALVLGMVQANNLFNAWPNSAVFTRDMARYLQPHARYLVEVDEVPIYYLRGHADAQPLPVHVHVLHRLHRRAGAVPHRERGLRGRDQGRLLPGDRLQLPDHAGGGPGDRARRADQPALPPGRRHPERQPHA